MTIPMIITYYECIPDLAYRENYQLAQLEATLLNMFGGKNNEGKSLPASRAFTPLERIAPWARPAGLRRGASGLTIEAARLLLRHAKELPSWALARAPLGEARVIAEGG